MHKEIIKKELIKTIRNWFIVLFEMDEYEKKSGLTEDQLLSDDNYRALQEKSSRLRIDSYRQVINSKRYILNSVIGLEEKILETIEQSKCFKNKFYDKELGEFLDTEFLIAENDIKARIEKIGLLFVTKTTKEIVDHLYEQAVNCYINGIFDACCIMCRAIVERVLKEICKEKLKSEDGFEKYTLYYLIEFCRKWNLAEGQTLELAENIRGQGKRSIHSETLADEKNAITSLRKTQAFLRDVLKRSTR